MLGLIGTLEMSRRSLDTSRQQIELTGHNLANVGNPAYARQRLKIQTAATLPDPKGPIGTGAEVLGIEQLRSQIIDSQVVAEASVTGFLQAKQQALQYGEVNLGQQLDRQSSNPEAVSAALGVGGQYGLVEGLADFFNSLQALSTSPNSSADRQVVVLKAQSLTERFSAIHTRLERLRTSLNTSIEENVYQVNALLQEISDLSKSISAGEMTFSGSANDLRDRRQAKLEALGKLVNVSYERSQLGPTNTFNLTISGVPMITENNLVDTLETFTDGSGGLQLTTQSGTALTATGGSILGTIDARDGRLLTLDNDVKKLAANLISEINQLHSAGFALDGVSTGEDFFTGTDSTDIAVNTLLVNDPSRIQASGNGDSGNNTVALNMAKLAAEPLAELGNLTFTENYNQIVANLGQELNNVSTQMQDQNAVDRMLNQQKDSVSGVSLDEEMANLVIFQRAFQASAKMITTVDELLQSVINLSR